jgi:hypothetical protein
VCTLTGESHIASNVILIGKRIALSKIRLTLQMSHGRGWRDSCVSTRRDRHDRWLWRLVGPFFHISDSVLIVRSCPQS